MRSIGHVELRFVGVVTAVGRIVHPPERVARAHRVSAARLELVQDTMNGSARPKNREPNGGGCVERD